MAELRRPPTFLAPEVRPGDLFTENGRDWLMLADVQWFWTGTAWDRSGSAEPVPPDVAADQSKIAAMRARVLRANGWLPP